MYFLVNSLSVLGVENVIESLGNSTFHDEFLVFLNNLFLIEHFSLVQLGTNEARFITSANVKGFTISKSLQKKYLTRYYKQDPNMQLYADIEHSNKVLLNRLKPQDIEDSLYQQFFGYDIKISDRISLLKYEDKGLYCLNLYRFHEQFSAEEIEQLTHFSSLLMSFVIKHARLAGSLSDFLTRETQIQELEQRLHGVNHKLTTREIDVCARILLGFSGEAIALDLDIKISSVQTYRKRAYAKLNISSQNELFGLCLKSE